jgi:hypothetical protein
MTWRAASPPPPSQRRGRVGVCFPWTMKLVETDWRGELSFTPHSPRKPDKEAAKEAASLKPLPLKPWSVQANVSRSGAIELNRDYDNSSSASSAHPKPPKSPSQAPVPPPATGPRSPPAAGRPRSPSTAASPERPRSISLQAEAPVSACPGGEESRRSLHLADGCASPPPLLFVCALPSQAHSRRILSRGLTQRHRDLCV